MIRREKTTTDRVYSSVRLPIRSSFGTIVAIQDKTAGRVASQRLIRAWARD